ncbi:MAG TPA: hypothetical protein VGM73_09440 [Candidatus Didemnitutus sp.]
MFAAAGGNGAGQLSGRILGSGGNFQATRDADDLAKVASAAADQNAGGPPVTSVTPRERPAAAAKPKAPPVPAPGADWRTAIAGVYTGTYGSNPDDEVTTKLYVKFSDNGSVNGVLDGLFIFDVPPSAGAEPITYTYKLIGSPQPGNGFAFWSVKPMGNPAPDAYASTQLWFSFVRSLVYGPTGKLESRFDPDQITGKVFGGNGRPTGNKIEAKRDKDESANVDRLMAAAQASAASAVNTAATRRSNSPPVSTTSIRPGIQGVFNGTYTRANEPPTKFKLTITQTRFDGNVTGVIGLAGVATIYLPTDAGLKAYTYSLTGTALADGHVSLSVNEWETIPPKDFKDFKAMGFDGMFRSNVNQNTARIVSVEEPSANVAANAATSGAGSKRRPGIAPATNATFFVPQFEATWDATESEDIRGTIAAQKAVGKADLAAALKAHEEVLKNATPKQLASKDLVRKSEAYWGGYRSDFIREVFDGGFASDVDDDPAFKSLFTDYVELFSKDCAAYLPAGHKTITITTITTTTYPGGATSSSTSSTTLEMDPRFIDKYAEFIGVEPAPGSDQEKEQTAKTIAIAGQIFHAGGPSHGTSPADASALLHLLAAHGLFGGAGMEKFFATELKANGPSAALRQMGENLLRGATGEPSLQEAGAAIDGARAETDQGLPPGRFARLIDAAHAFYRDPANARFAGRFETAFDETLAAKYRGVMTREEEYYYANDFETRFRDQIMQPRDRCTDPAWARLHPAVEETVAAIGQ